MLMDELVLMLLPWWIFIEWFFQKLFYEHQLLESSINTSSSSNIDFNYYWYHLYLWITIAHPSWHHRLIIWKCSRTGRKNTGRVWKRRVGAVWSTWKDCGLDKTKYFRLRQPQNKHFWLFGFPDMQLKKPETFYTKSEVKHTCLGAYTIIMCDSIMCYLVTYGIWGRLIEKTVTRNSI